MIVVAIGIIGATVMPHNLYLHSALVQTRKLEKDDKSIRRALRFNTIDSVIALTIAFFINAAILVLAAMVFFGKESVTVPGTGVVAFGPDADWIRVAYLTLAPLAGNRRREHALRRGAAGQRSEQHHHGHARRAGGHGRLHAVEARAVDSAAVDPHAGHSAGDYHRRRAGRQQRERPAGPEPGRVGPATSVRHVPAAAFHVVAKADGSVEERLVFVDCAAGAVRC